MLNTSVLNKCAINSALVLLFTLPLASGVAWANQGGGDKKEKSQGHEKKKGDKHDAKRNSDQKYEKEDEKDKRNASDRREHFGDQQRIFVRDYYGTEYRSGRCPPGLAKKHNGCMPPGQAKKWQVGRPLPREVIYYAVPPTLVVQLGQPPQGHRYVRVAGDILMIAVGTAMVVDAINDLGL